MTKVTNKVTEITVHEYFGKNQEMLLGGGFKIYEISLIM